VAPFFLLLMLLMLPMAALAGSPVPDQQPATDPVSIERIRTALEKAPVVPLKGVDERPNFRVEIRERQIIDELLQRLKFESGPPVPGGLYAYQQLQALFPKLDAPQRIPAMGGLPLLPIGHAIVKAVSNARRTRAEEAAREEVQRALDEFWASQDKPSTDKKDPIKR
jgi:hypothetical protein